MKKNVLFLSLVLSLAMGGQIRAQYSDYYYHIVGDTIEWKANNGYYSWWEFEPFFQQNLVMKLGDYGTYTHGELDSMLVLMEFYTPTPLKIIGIAGTGFRGRVGYYSTDHINPDTNLFQEYYYIYDAAPSGMILKKKLPWNSFVPERTVHIKIHRDWYETPEEWYTERNDSCCWYKPVEYYMPLHEYYFDSAIYVFDSFYVGGSYFGNMSCHLTGIPSSDSIHTTYWYASLGSLGKDIVCVPELQNSQNGPPFCSYMGIHTRYKFRQELFSSSHTPPFEQLPWRDVRGGAVLLVYPIVEVDTTVPPADACPPVANIEAVVSGNTATVTWDDFPNYSTIHLNYGPCNVPQSQWTTVDVSGDSHYTLTDLNHSTCYRMRLSAKCSEKAETPWSSPITFYTGQDTTITGIQPTILSQLTFLAPNPAHSEFVVTSSFNLQEIDIWNVNGICVHHQSITGHQATVSVDFLRPGTYIVAIRTHNGTTHKTLLIR